jgi:hypothetical protein
MSITLLDPIISIWNIYFNQEEFLNDWPSYVEQAEYFLEGEFDYSKIRGSNGYVYYPAGHLYFYALLSVLGINYSIIGSMLFMAFLHWI